METSRGRIDTPIVVLTGGPELAEVAGLAGVRVPAGGVRHQVAVTEPHPDLDPARVPMVFDLTAGLYWRPEEKGLLFGMSNPAERPGPAARVDDEYLAKMRGRLAELVPVTRGLGLRRIWAATIDYTPDHLPIIGPALINEGALYGVTVASAGGAGMMWGPGVARAAADVALTGRSDVVDTAVAGPGPVRRRGQQPPGDRPDRAAVPVQRAQARPPRFRRREDSPDDRDKPGTPFLAAAATAELEDWGPLEEATGEPMQTSGYTLWQDGEQESGVWECTPGPSYWKLETNEFVHIVSGRMTVTPDGGAPQEIGPGDAAVFPRGWAGTWQIHETIRKLYVIF